MNCSQLCLFSTSKLALLSLSNSFIIWLLFYCYLRVDALLYGDSEREHWKVTITLEG